MKTIDLASKPKDGMAVATVIPEEPSEIFYPSHYLNDREGLEDAPDAGSTGSATIQYKVVSKTDSMRADGNGQKKSTSVELEILSITFSGETEEEDDEIERGLREAEKSMSEEDEEDTEEED
jgi:hypothetical protein